MWPTPTSLNGDTPSPPSPRPTSESMGSLVHILKRKKAVRSGFQPSWAGVIPHCKHGPSPGRPLPALEGAGLHLSGKRTSQHMQSARRWEETQTPVSKSKDGAPPQQQPHPGASTAQGGPAPQAQPHTRGCAPREAMSFTGAVALPELSPSGKHGPPHMSANKPPFLLSLRGSLHTQPGTAEVRASTLPVTPKQVGVYTLRHSLQGSVSLNVKPPQGEL